MRLNPEYVENNKEYIDKLLGEDGSNAFSEIEMKRIDVAPDFKLPKVKTIGERLSRSEMMPTERELLDASRYTNEKDCDVYTNSHLSIDYHPL